MSDTQTKPPCYRKKTSEIPSTPPPTSPPSSPPSIKLKRRQLRAQNTRQRNDSFSEEEYDGWCDGFSSGDEGCECTKVNGVYVLGPHSMLNKNLKHFVSINTENFPKEEKEFLIDECIRHYRRNHSLCFGFLSEKQLTFTSSYEGLNRKITMVLKYKNNVADMSITFSPNYISSQM